MGSIRESSDEHGLICNRTERFDKLKFAVELVWRRLGIRSRDVSEPAAIWELLIATWQLQKSAIRHIIPGTLLQFPDRPKNEIVSDAFHTV